MNGHVTPADHDSLHCKGVDSAEGPHPNHTAEGTPAVSAPEYAQVSPPKCMINMVRSMCFNEMGYSNAPVC